MLEFVLNTSGNVFCQYLGVKASDVEHQPSFLAVAHRYFGHEEDNSTKASHLVS